MSFLQSLSNLLAREPRVPVDLSPAVEKLTELDALVAQSQDLGRQIDALREQRRQIALRIADLVKHKNAAGVVVQGQVVTADASAVRS